MRSSLIIGLLFTAIGLRLMLAGASTNAVFTLVVGLGFVAYWYFAERGDAPVEPEPGDFVPSTTKSTTRYLAEPARKTTLPRLNEDPLPPLGRNGNVLDGRPIEEQLRLLNAAGMELLNIDPATDFPQAPLRGDSDALIHLVCGNNDNERSLLRNFLHFDTECIADSGTFRELTLKLIALAPELRAKLDEFDAGADLDISEAWLTIPAVPKMTVRQIYLKQNEDWLDLDLLIWLQHILKQYSATERYVGYPTDGQDMIVGCITLEQLAQFRALGVNFFPIPG